MSRVKKLKILMLLIGFCFVGCSADADSEKAEEALEPIVRIAAGDVSGSGVIYDRTEEQIIIATAGHVLEPAGESGEPAEIVFGDGYSVETTSYVISRTSETAFISIALEDIPAPNLERYEPAASDKARFDGLKDGDEVVFKGAQSGAEQSECEQAGNGPAEGGSAESVKAFICRGAGEMLYPWIYVEDFQQYMMLIKGESFPGMSGGGVFDGEGYFVGILCGVNEAGETAAVPLTVIIAEYMQLSDEWK